MHKCLSFAPFVISDEIRTALRGKLWIEKNTKGENDPSALHKLSIFGFYSGDDMRRRRPIQS